MHLGLFLGIPIGFDGKKVFLRSLVTKEKNENFDWQSDDRTDFNPKRTIIYQGVSTLCLRSNPRLRSRIEFLNLSMFKLTQN